MLSEMTNQTNCFFFIRRGNSVLENFGSLLSLWESSGEFRPLIKNDTIENCQCFQHIESRARLQGGVSKIPRWCRVLDIPDQKTLMSYFQAKMRLK